METDRLLLRELSTEIMDDLFQNYQASEQAKFLGTESPLEFQDLLLRYRRGLFVDTPWRSYRIWLLVDKASGKVIGDCGYHDWNKRNQYAEIGYGLRHDGLYNKGYMSEALRSVIEYGFRTMDIQRIEAQVGPDNLASLRLMEKFHFTREGLMRKRYNDDGKQLDTIMFSLLRSDYFLIDQLQETALADLVAGFEQRSLTAGDWTHEAHLKVAFWYLSRYSSAEATLLLRQGIITLNHTLGIENSSTSGYHETITQFWIQWIYTYLHMQEAGNDLEHNLQQFLNSPLAEESVILQFYSRELLSSLQARAMYLPPDRQDISADLMQRAKNSGSRITS